MFKADASEQNSDVVIIYAIKTVLCLKIMLCLLMIINPTPRHETCTSHDHAAPGIFRVASFQTSRALSGTAQAPHFR